MAWAAHATALLALAALALLVLAQAVSSATFDPARLLDTAPGAAAPSPARTGCGARAETQQPACPVNMTVTMLALQASAPFPPPPAPRGRAWAEVVLRATRTVCVAAFGTAAALDRLNLVVGCVVRTSAR